MSKLEFESEEEVEETPKAPEPEKPEGQTEYKRQGETVKILIPDAHGYTTPVVVTHPDYPLGEKRIVIKRNEPVEVDERVLAQLDQPYFIDYVQDTDENGNPYGKMRRVEKKRFPYHIVS